MPLARARAGQIFPRPPLNAEAFETGPKIEQGADIRFGGHLTAFRKSGSTTALAMSQATSPGSSVSGSQEPMPRRRTSLGAPTSCERFTGWIVLMQLGVSTAGIALFGALFASDSGVGEGPAGLTPLLSRLGLWLALPVLCWGAIAGALSPLTFVLLLPARPSATPGHETHRTHRLRTPNLQAATRFTVICGNIAAPW